MLLDQVIPNLTIFVLSCAILLRARKMRKELNNVLQKEKSTEDFKRQMILIWTMLIVYLAFVRIILLPIMLTWLMPVSLATQYICLIF